MDLSSTHGADLRRDATDLSGESTRLATVQVSPAVALRTRGEIVESRTTGTRAPTTVLPVCARDLVPEASGGSTRVPARSLTAASVAVRSTGTGTSSEGGTKLVSEIFCHPDFFSKSVHAYFSSFNGGSRFSGLPGGS